MHVHDSTTLNEGIELRKNAVRCRRAIDERFYENAFIYINRNFTNIFENFASKIKMKIQMTKSNIITK